EGHSTSLTFMLFSHAGDRVASCSKDGAIKVWRQQPSARPPHQVCPARVKTQIAAWTLDMSLECEADECERAQLAAGPGPAGRQRKKPAPTIINQVAWSCDDRLVLAVVSDNTVRVWNAAKGRQLHVMRGHIERVHVLGAHPLEPRLLFTTGYDGLTLLWDCWRGVLLN
ncbi:putative bromodomain, auxin response factor, coatomer alpha subunit, partial [Haematococcus lacustris]